MLGIVIGVGAVIAMVTIGNGTTAKVTADLSKLGSNLMFVRPGQFGPGRASTDAKPFNAARRRGARGPARRRARRGAGRSKVGHGHLWRAQPRHARSTGTDNDYFVTQDWMLAAGRQFLEGEISGGGAVCIIGETVARGDVRHRRAGRQEHPGGERLLRGDRPARGQGPVEHRHRPGRHGPDAAARHFSAVSPAIPTSEPSTSRHETASTPPRSRPISNGCCASAVTSRRGQEDDFSVRDMKQLAQTTVARPRC